MTKQEPMLSAWFTAQQKQVLVSGLHVQENQFCRRIGTTADEKELSPRIAADVEGKVATNPSPCLPDRNSLTKLHSRSDLLERANKEFHIFVQI